MEISIARPEDVEEIVTLLNSAYRGESSAKGWTTEAHLIAGNIRSDAASVLNVMQQAESIILKCTNNEQKIIGTVNLQQHGNRMYLGMFAVEPEMQGAGIGKKLLQYADAHAKSLNCSSIYMSVISVRTELINWYKRFGYVDTGERKPFHEDGLTGRHLQPLEFAIFEKSL